MAQEMIKIPKKEYEKMVATIETLRNREVMKQLRKSDKDVERGDVRDANQFSEELDSSGN